MEKSFKTNQLAEVQKFILENVSELIDILKTTEDKETKEVIIKEIEQLYEEYGYIYLRAMKRKMKKYRKEIVDELRGAYLEEE